VVATGAVDGSMTIPADVHIVGWYNGTDSYQGTTYSVRTPWPGQPGVSVLAGHINWVGQGPGALYYIGQLVVGDPVEVVGSDRVATYWRVSQPPITLPKSDLPASLFVNTGPPKLALVTCGGPYDSATGHYLDNVIVWAKVATR
jgi:sortase (surface protein transpeptidase)